MYLKFFFNLGVNDDLRDIYTAFHSEGTVPEILSISFEYYFCNFSSKNVHFKHMLILWDETGNKCFLS